MLNNKEDDLDNSTLLNFGEIIYHLEEEKVMIIKNFSKEAKTDVIEATLRVSNHFLCPHTGEFCTDEVCNNQMIRIIERKDYIKAIMTCTRAL